MDLCFFAFLVIPSSSLAPWKRCWGCGAWAAQPLLDPRMDPGLGTGKQKGFWVASCGSIPSGTAPAAGWWPWGACPKPGADPGNVSCASCGLWLQIWGILAPQDLAAPQDVSRVCRKGCSELLLRLVLRWNVGTGLEPCLSRFIPGNPGCSCPPCGAEGWEVPGLSHSSQGSPVGSRSCSRYFSLLLGCVSCLNIPSEESPDGCTAGILSERDTGLSLWIPRDCPR